MPDWVLCDSKQVMLNFIFFLISSTLSRWDPLKVPSAEGAESSPGAAPAKPGGEPFPAGYSPKGSAAPCRSLESPRGSCRSPGEGEKPQSWWLPVRAAPRSHRVPSS